MLQARNAKFKGGTSATNMYAWSKYLYGVPFVATVDFDAPDAYLVDENSQWQSRWLMKNTERVCLSQGATFYDQAKLPKRKLHNCFSLCSSNAEETQGVSTAVETHSHYERRARAKQQQCSHS